MRKLNRFTDRVLDKLVGRTSAAAGCSETSQVCRYITCSGGLRRCCKTCYYSGSPCHQTGCTTETCGPCMLA